MEINDLIHEEIIPFPREEFRRSHAFLSFFAEVDPFLTFCSKNCVQCWLKWQAAPAKQKNLFGSPSRKSIETTHSVVELHTWHILAWLTKGGKGPAKLCANRRTAPWSIRVQNAFGLLCPGQAQERNAKLLSSTTIWTLKTMNSVRCTHKTGEENKSTSSG